MYRHAIIKDNVVTSVIKATDEFAASLSDTTVKIEDDASIGKGHTYNTEDGTFTAPEAETDPTLSLEEFQEFQIGWRNRELTFTDSIVPVTDLPDHASWMTYRQNLRDWPSTDDFPNDRPYPAHLSASIVADEEGPQIGLKIITEGVQL